MNLAVIITIAALGFIKSIYSRVFIKTNEFQMKRGLKEKTMEEFL
jgi:hypothetical protein